MRTIWPLPQHYWSPMSRYYPLIARAVAGADKNTSGSRRATYERLAAALVTSLQRFDPPLSRERIESERRAFEEAVRQVETEQAASRPPENTVQLQRSEPDQAHPMLEPRVKPHVVSVGQDHDGPPDQEDAGMEGELLYASSHNERMPTIEPRPRHS